jgi:3-oxoacyl-[acyl-carrier protein] reductase
MSAGGRNAVAIVTGGGSGIGRAIARRFAADGAAVTVNDFVKERAEAVAGEIIATGGQAVAVGGDVANENEVANIIAVGKAAFGDATVLVNCAGHVHQAPFLEIAPADFDRIFAVHVRGVYLCTRAVLPAMLAAKSGAIVNIASQLGQIGGIELAHYSAAKAAIIGLTKSLAREYSAKGVRINGVAPGPIETPLVMALSEDWRRRKAAELPLGRFGQPEEVAATVAFLASDEASLFVGQTLGPNSGDVMQ